MSTTKAFRGFTPARKKGGGYNNEAVTDIIAWSSTGLAGTPTNNIFTGDPVVLPRCKLCNNISVYCCNFETFWSIHGLSIC